VAQIPPELIYSLTAHDIDQPAFIQGSKRKDSFPLFDVHTVHVYSIDGKVTQYRRKSWSDKIPIEPGHTQLSAEYRHGAYHARGTIEFEAKPNAVYELRFKDYHMDHVDFWIVEAESQEPVTGIASATMNGGTTTTTVFVPVN
jgi:hypothetical protein